MNINQVQKMFNDTNAPEVRTLELRVGQVVRGVVTQQLPNQEALVNINGIQVKAKLEVPILEGQATLMQVAPDSKGSFIHLKQVDPATLGLNDPMKDILKTVQLPDKDWSNQLVRELRQEGFPLNRETLQALAQAVKLAPTNVDLESWMQAATQAFKRGMPMTLSTISSMHQLSQGTPLHQLVTQLQQQLTQLFTQQGQTLSGPTAHLLQQLNQGLSQMMQGQTLNQTKPDGQVQATMTPSQSNTMTTPNQQPSQAPQQVNVQQNPIAAFMKALGVQHEQQLSQTLMNQVQSESRATTQASPINQSLGQNQQSTSQAPVQTNQTQMTNQSSQIISASVSQAQTQQAQQGVQSQQVNQTNVSGMTQQSQQQQTPVQQGVASPSQVLQTQQGIQPNLAQHSTANQGLIGHMIQTETSDQPVQQLQQPAQQTAVHQQLSANQQSSSPLLHAQLQAEGQVAQSTAPAIQQNESVKATVLALLQASDVPLQVKEGLTQLLNHITGQQMMLAAERNHSMFTHITMYIPLKDEQGGQTAAIHVQTRRDRKGQLDAENCRIVFDLNMNRLGQTMVDMNVMNKIVSLNIWNDSSFIQPLIDSLRPEIIEALQKTGYSLSSVRTTSFKQEEKSVLAEAKAMVQPPDIQHMNAARYKGVDFKV